MAEHRVHFVELAHARFDFGRRDAQFLGHFGLASSASCGRNSCSGGSSRRIVTGRPFIALKMPTKSSR